MRWAVSYISFLDNDLQIDVVEASTWKEALTKHYLACNGGSDQEAREYIASLSEVMMEAATEVLAAEWSFDIKRVDDVGRADDIRTGDPLNGIVDGLTDVSDN